MKELRLNIKHISRITIYDKLQDNSYFWDKQSKFLWFITAKEGFYYYDMFGCKYRTPEEMKNIDHRYIEDKKVFYDPHIEIKTTDGKTTILWFKSVSELYNFLNQYQLKSITWVTHKVDD